MWSFAISSGGTDRYAWEPDHQFMREGMSTLGFIETLPSLIDVDGKRGSGVSEILTRRSLVKVKGMNELGSRHRLCGKV